MSFSTPLISVEALSTLAASPRLRLIDLRWHLNGPSGADLYARGHLDGAVFVDLEAALTAPVGPGRHPIASRAQFERAMRAAGVSNDTTVVVYDDAGGSVASRLWWLLRYYGHTEVAVLDGGLARYEALGGALSTRATAPEPGSFVAKPGAMPVVSALTVEARAAEPEGALLLDARAPERYRGEVEPVDARAGHIPSARNAFWQWHLDGAVFRSREALAAHFAALGVTPSREVIAYCGSGVTASQLILALTYAMPSLTVSLYEGSWSDWCRDPSRPIATGEAPGQLWPSSPSPRC